jgi:O-antigen/teichoic acid export membrane protein
VSDEDDKAAPHDTRGDDDAPPSEGQRGPYRESNDPHEGKRLLSKIVSETSLFAVLSVISSLLAWTTNLLLARLLDKRDFGVYGICTFFLGVGSLIGDGGLAVALLRKKHELSRDALRAAAAFALSVGVAMTLLLTALAPWLGERYHLTARETTVLRVMAPLYLVSAVRMIPYVKLERSLQFGAIARVELYASLARHALALVVAAALEGGVWALVLSNIVGSVLQCALAFRAAPGWPGVGWKWNVLKPMLGFGAKVEALGILAYVKDNVSRAMLGQALGPAAVGLFDFGLNYIQLPVLAVNSLARVQLPVYAQLDAKDPTLYAALRGALRVAAILGVPALAALAVIAPWAVPTFYSPQWAPSYPVIWGLVGNMVAGLAASPLFGLMQGQNRAGLAIGVFAAWTSATWALSVASVLLFPGDLGKIAWCYSAVTVVVVAGMFVWTQQLLGRSLFSAVRGPVIAGLVGLALSLAQRTHESGVLAHPIACAVTALIGYFFVLMILEGPEVLSELKELVRKRRS